jgi:hypothetical protein
MSFYFFLEFTAEDRIKFEPKIINGDFKGLRAKYQSAKKLDKVNYSVVGFDPFFEYEWLTVVKYDNMKGDAVKDLLRPTPVTFSPLGLHVKESWGRLDNRQFVARIMEDLKGWVDLRIKANETLAPVDTDRNTIGERNLVRAAKLVNFLFDFQNPESIEAFNKIYEGQTLIPIPEPEEDDWILEENSVGANRIEKRAHRGDPDILSYGPFKVLSYQRSGEESQDN